MADDRVHAGGADNSPKSDIDKSGKRKRVDEQRTPISESVPENSRLVLKGTTNIAGNIIYQSGYNSVKLKNIIRKKHRHASKSKERRSLTEDETIRRESDVAQAQVAATEEKWGRRDNELGYKLTDADHKDLKRQHVMNVKKECLFSKV